MRYSEGQVNKFKDVFVSLETYRKNLTLYKKGNNSLGLSMFRLKASRVIVDLTARHVLDKKHLKETREFVNLWGNDPGAIGEYLRLYIEELEKITGKNVKL